MLTQIKLICPCLPIEKIVSCYLCQQPFGHWPGNPFGLSALALVFLIACHGLDESWLIIQEDRHAKSLPWACCTFLVMCVKASLCVCYSHVSRPFLSMCTCAYQSIFPWLERPFFQSCQKTKIGSGFWELLEMLWLGVVVIRIFSLLMDGWNMNTSPDVLQWWSSSPAIAKILSLIYCT